MDENPNPENLQDDIIPGGLAPERKHERHAPEAAALDADEIVEWDEPVEATGHRVPRVEMEDEESPVIQLVEQGLEKADDSTREQAQGSE
jgi:hypothetical protein